LGHQACHHAVDLGPGRARRWREGVAQPLAERLEQRRAHGVVVCCLHAVALVALGQALQHRHQRGQVIELADRRADHLHQALALLLHVALEQRAQAGIGGDDPPRPEA
jgi:CHASE1-domain containing sensor protein